jgi:hypothetical protein
MFENCLGDAMSEENENSTPPVDPFETLRKMRDAYLEGMSKVMIDAVNTEEYTQSTSGALTNLLAVMAPFREALDKSMAIALDQFSLPSREQVAALSERFTNIELRLDDLDAKLDRIVELSSSAGAAAAGASPTGKWTVATNPNVSRQARNRKS